MNRSLALVLLAATFLALPSSSRAARPADVTLDGKSFTCLGSGLRKKLFIKVYALTFCLESSAAKAGLARFLSWSGEKYAGLEGEALGEALSRDAKFFEFLIGLEAEKAVQLAFLRDVSAEKVRDSFREGLGAAMGLAAKPRIEALLQLIDTDIRDGDRFWVTTAPSGKVAFRMGSNKSVEDAEIARAIWRIYLGAEGVSPSLKASVARGAAELMGSRSQMSDSSG